jgi:MazG family protein
LTNWEKIKQQEKKTAPSESLLGGVSSAMPALLEAHKLSKKAAGAGFDWPDIEGIFDKLTEETQELREELKQSPSSGKIPDDLKERLEGEIGDLFFVLVNMARYLSVDSESALKKSNRKFKSRFQFMEKQLKAAGGSVNDSSAEELDALWRQAKDEEQQ